MSLDFGNDFDLQGQEGGGGSGWNGLPPSARAALIMWVFLLAIATINSFTGTTSLIFCYPIQLLLYVGNGYMAGRFALDSGYSSSDLPRVGATAGLIAWIAPTLFYFVFGALLGIVTIGAGFIVGAAICIVCGPIDLAIHATCAAFGGWFAGRGGSGGSATNDLAF